MELRKRYLLFFGFILLLNVSKAQNVINQKDKIIEERIDFLLDENEGGDLDYTTLFEQLSFYYNKPINLNNASEDELIGLNLLNGFQINNLLTHIVIYGKLISFEELQSIDGFTVEDIKRILPFTKVSGDLSRPVLSFKNILKEGDAQLFMRYSSVLETQKGFSPIEENEFEENPDRRYLGSPDRLYSRFRFKYANNLSFGITAEKDPGEEFFKGSQKNGFDFYSAHFFLQGFGTVKQLAIGDFQAQFGQGLTFWSGMAFGRSPNVFTLKRNPQKLRPYTSVQENLFLRGGGITLAHKQMEWTVFYSSAKVDANISSFDSLNNEFTITSLPETGFHRTPSELENKNVVDNSFLGSNLSYNHRKIKVGITAVHNQIAANYLPRQKLYNKFNRLQNENTNFGFDYNYLLKNVNFFGEISHSINGGIAYTNGLLVVLDPRLSLAIQNRKFDKDYVPLQSNAVGENTSNSNESGTFMGINAKLSPVVSLSAYADRFAFSWLRFQTDAPSQGYRIMSQLSYEPSRAMEVYFRFRQRNRGKNESETTEGVAAIVDEIKSDYRLHLAYQVTKSITLKNRIEITNYQLGDKSRERGFVIYQDLSYKQLSFPLSFSIRYAIFDTDFWNSRIYAYENDVLYAFSIPAYSGKGTRFYISSKYHISRGIDFWLRYSQTYYTDRNTIGSGKDEISGNIKSEIKAQLRFKF